MEKSRVHIVNTAFLFGSKLERNLRRILKLNFADYAEQISIISAFSAEITSAVFMGT